MNWRGLDYDPETGFFTWVGDTGNQYRGTRAGSIEKKGYRQIEAEGFRYMAHRLAWFLMTGSWPKHQIDHINGIKDDNRWCNLREATNAENKRNAGRRADNTSGYKCVTWHGGKWSVSVKFPWATQQVKCGRFSNIIDAAVCANYNIAYAYGDFARLNQIPEGEWSHD